jgi:hypothetical protein
MKHLVILLIFFVFTACQRHFPITPTSSYVGTHWGYKDPDTDYEIYFQEDGTFSHSLSGDFTSGNDFWYEKDGKLHLFMNNGYARYTGIVVDSGWVAGTAKNRKGAKWDWQMRKME